MSRMWMVDPKTMCRQHLLGEHNEVHKFIGSLKKGHNLTGFVTAGILDSSLLFVRHEQLAQEMIARGYNHKSPLDPIRWDEEFATRHVGIGQLMPPWKSYRELARRCKHCRERIKNANIPYTE